MASKKQQKEETKVEVVNDIDPRIQAMMDLNKKTKLPEREKQAGIYSAMAKIQVERN